MVLRQAALKDIPALLGLQKNIIDFERSFDQGIRENAIYYPETELEEIINNEMGRIVVLDEGTRLVGCGFGSIVTSSGWDAFDKKGVCWHDVCRPQVRTSQLSWELNGLGAPQRGARSILFKNHLSHHNQAHRVVLGFLHTQPLLFFKTQLSKPHSHEPIAFLH